MPFGPFAAFQNFLLQGSRQIVPVKEKAMATLNQKPLRATTSISSTTTPMVKSPRTDSTGPSAAVPVQGRKEPARHSEFNFDAEPDITNRVLAECIGFLRRFCRLAAQKPGTKRYRDEIPASELRQIALPADSFRHSIKNRRNWLCGNGLLPPWIHLGEGDGVRRANAVRFVGNRGSAVGF